MYSAFTIPNELSVNDLYLKQKNMVLHVFLSAYGVHPFIHIHLQKCLSARRSFIN